MNQLENKLSSREVCEMMEMEHAKLLRKIDDINLDFRESKIGFSKYWQESTYKVEGQLREYREFQITKKGCEFLAHKTTGTKGNLFTDKYMDKFAAMENVIRTGSYTPIGKTRTDEVLEIIKTLPTDKYKNKAVAELMRLIPVEQKKSIGNVPHLNLEAILEDFLTNDDVILKRTEHGIAVDKSKLYKFFEVYGLKYTETLRALDNADLIYHKPHCRTVQIKYGDGNTIRVVMIKE